MSAEPRSAGFTLRAQPGASWITLDQGVELLVRPYNSAEWFAARRSSGVHPDDERGIYMLAEVAARCAQDWRGVFGEDGKPLGFSADLVRTMILGYPEQAVAFSVAYNDLQQGWGQEKKVSEPAPNGTTKAARRTAKRAATLASRAQKAKPTNGAGAVPT